MAGAVVLATAITVPKRYISRVVAFPVIADIASSSYVLSVFAGTATITGLQVGVFAALGLTIATRVARKYYGAERLAVDGNISLRVVAAAALDQASSWIKALTKSLFTRQAVQAPEPVNWSWVKTA